MARIVRGRSIATMVLPARTHVSRRSRGEDRLTPRGRDRSAPPHPFIILLQDTQKKKKIALERLRSKGIRGELLQSDPRSSWPVCAPPTHTVHLPQPLTANLTLALPYAR